MGSASLIWYLNPTFFFHKQFLAVWHIFVIPRANFPEFFNWIKFNELKQVFFSPDKFVFWINQQVDRKS